MRSGELNLLNHYYYNNSSLQINYLSSELTSRVVGCLAPISILTARGLRLCHYCPLRMWARPKKGTQVSTDAFLNLVWLGSRKDCQFTRRRYLSS